MTLEPPKDVFQTILWDNLYLIEAIALTSYSVILALVGKRDMTAITFIVIAAVSLICYASGLKAFYDPRGVEISIVMILIALMMIATRDKQRFVCSWVLLSIAIGRLAVMYALPESGISGVSLIGYVIAIALNSSCIYFAICLYMENHKMPLYDVLASDEEDKTEKICSIQFRKSGMMAGFMMFTVPIFASIFRYAGWFNLSTADLLNINFACGLALLLIGILIIVFGRILNIPSMFVVAGVMLMVIPLLTDLTGLAILMCFITVLAIQSYASDMRILLSIMLVSYTISWILSDSAALSPNPEIMIVLGAIECIILTYVSLVLCSDRNLKLL